VQIPPQRGVGLPPRSLEDAEGTGRIPPYFSGALVPRFFFVFYSLFKINVSIWSITGAFVILPTPMFCSRFTFLKQGAAYIR